MKIGKSLICFFTIIFINTAAFAIPFTYSVNGEVVYDVSNPNGPTFGKIWGAMIIDDAPATTSELRTSFNVLGLDIHLDDQFEFKGYGTLTHHPLNTSLRLTGTSGDWYEWTVSDDRGYLGSELLVSYEWVEQFILNPRHGVFLQKLTIARPIPEPSSLFLIMSGIIGVFGLRHRFFKDTGKA